MNHDGVPTLHYREGFQPSASQIGSAGEVNPTHRGPIGSAGEMYPNQGGIGGGAYSQGGIGYGAQPQPPMYQGGGIGSGVGAGYPNPGIGSGIGSGVSTNYPPPGNGTGIGSGATPMYPNHGIGSGIGSGAAPMYPQAGGIGYGAAPSPAYPGQAAPIGLGVSSAAEYLEMVADWKSHLVPESRQLFLVAGGPIPFATIHGLPLRRNQLRAFTDGLSLRPTIFTS
ncbi:hypothetical protein Q1695_013975 [Nippostrongylus brasiliensis]|nr:hypothetical protein Q1695_013975 [Nippostrongylus brasiliensis]